MPFEPDPVDPTRRAALLDRIRAEVPRRRARRRAIASIGTAAIVLVAVGLALVPGRGDGPERIEVADGGASTSAGDGATAETKPTLLTTTATPVTTVPDTTEGPPATTPPTASIQTVPPTDPSHPCAGSVDPACGPLVFDPPPAANQPITVTAAADPGPPYAEGQTVHLTFTVDDPDAPVTADCVHVVAHHTITTLAAFPGCDSAASTQCLAPPPRYGTWPTPPPTPGHLVVTYDLRLEHEQNTSVLVQVTVQSGTVCPSDANSLYASTADQTFEYSWG